VRRKRAAGILLSLRHPGVPALPSNEGSQPPLKPRPFRADNVLVSEAYLSLIPAVVPASGDAADASTRICRSTERLRSFRARLELVQPLLTELEHKAASAAADLAQAQAQASVDREAVVRLEAALAEREELRSSLRERLSELGRMLGS